MDVILKVLNGTKSGHELVVRGRKFFVGRAEDCHLRPKSDLISRHHCVLLIDESGVVVRDLESRNGTFVNGEKITSATELSSGDKLKIGPLEFQIIVRKSTGAKKRPKVKSVKEAAARTAEGSSQDDMDVSDWLDKEQTDQAATETQEIQAGETEEIDLSQASGLAPDEPTPSPAASAKPADKPKQALPPKSFKPGAADSKTAAEDVLRKFFTRR